MATKAKKPTSKKTSNKKAATTVTRIKASDTKPSQPAVIDVTPEIKIDAKKATQASTKKSAFAPLVAIGGYFKGAWYELRQVRWPNRKETWSLTAGVLIFSAFFVLLIVLLDALFKYLFELILK